MSITWAEGVDMKLFLKTIVLTVVMALFAACGSSNFEWFPEANKAPVANAGANQSVIVGDTVTLDGSASSDANKDKLIYSWAFTSRPTDSAATLSGATTVSPTFTADKAGSYVLSLIVNDGEVNSTAATVTVTASVGNAPPVAKITVTSNTVAVGSSVAVSGSGSTDENSDPLTYRWTLTAPTSSTAVLSSATAVSPTFTPDLPGAYVLSLTVNDGKADSATPATATITASTLPVANAGSDKSVFVGDTVTLDGSASTAPNGGTIATYTWTFTTPATGAPTLDTTVPAKPTFTASVAGTYVISLIVNDGKANSAADSVTVTVKPFAAVVANAGVDQDVALNQTVTLDGSASTDKRGVTGTNGGTLKYSWNWSGAGSKPDGAGSVSLSGADTVNPTFTPTVTGTYKITLQVNDLTDPNGTGDTDEVIVRCNLGSITVTW